MSLKPEDLQILADCPSEIISGPVNVVALAHDSRGRIAVVPAGRKWLIAFVEVNSVAGAAATVWIVPSGESVVTTTVKWTVIPTITLTAGTAQTRVAVMDRPIRVMMPGDSIWLKGGSTLINLYVLGWEVSL